MATTFEAIKNFAREYGYALNDLELERDFDRLLYNTMERNSTIEGYKKMGLEEGRKLGLEQGRKQGRADVIAELRELGVNEGLLAQVANR